MFHALQNPTIPPYPHCPQYTQQKKIPNFGTRDNQIFLDNYQASKSRSLRHYQKYTKECKKWANISCN